MLESGFALDLADLKSLPSTPTIASGQRAGLNRAWLSSRGAGGQLRASSFGIHNHQLQGGLGLKAKLRQDKAFAGSGAQVSCPACSLHPLDLGGVGVRSGACQTSAAGVGFPVQVAGRGEGSRWACVTATLALTYGAGPLLHPARLWGGLMSKGLLVHLCMEGSVGLLLLRGWSREGRVNFQRLMIIS